MKSFKVWLENDRSEYARRKNYFDQVMRVLQATEDDLSRPLDQLDSVKTPKPQDGESQPPTRGKNSLLKVNQLLGDIFQKMSKDREDTDSSVRASRTMEFLRKRTSDGKVTPVVFLQDLLRELFGNDFHEEFIKNKPTQDNTPTPSPDDNASIQSDPGKTDDLNTSGMQDPSGFETQDDPMQNDPTQPMQDPNQMQDDPTQMQIPQKKPFGGNKFI